MGRLLCAVGLHRWERGRVKGYDLTDGMVPMIVPERRCARCPRWQVLTFGEWA